MRLCGVDRLCAASVWGYGVVVYCVVVYGMWLRCLVRARLCVVCVRVIGAC